MKVQFSSQWNNFFLDLRTEKWNKIMVLAIVLQFSRLKKRSPKKDKASTGFETVPSRYLLIINATISSPSTDHIVVLKDNFTFIFKSLFCNWPEIRSQSFKIPFKFTFHGVILLTQDHIFCSDSYRASVNFYRVTTQILWLLPSAHSGDKWW